MPALRQIYLGCLDNVADESWPGHACPGPEDEQEDEGRVARQGRRSDTLEWLPAGRRL
jgi:hypothetical protein